MDLCKHPAGCSQRHPGVVFQCSFINKVQLYLQLRFVREKLLEWGRQRDPSLLSWRTSAAEILNEQH